MIARTMSLGHDSYQPAIRILCVACGNAFRNNRAAAVPPDVNHLGARIGLLVVIRYGD